MAGAASATAALSSVSDSSTSSVTSTNPNMKKKKRFSSSRNSIPSLKRRKVKNGDDGASETETKSAPAAIENPKKMSAENPPIGRRPGGNSSFPPPRSSQVEDSTPCWCQLISEYPQNDTIKISSKSFSVGWNKGCDLRLDDKAQNGILCIIKQSKVSPEGYFKAMLHINKKGYVQLNEKTLLENTFRNLCSGDELQFGMCGYHSYIFQQIRNREGSDDCHEAQATSMDILLDPKSGAEVLVEKSIRNSQTASIPGTSPGSTAFKEMIHAGILHSKNIEVSFEKFPWFISETTKDMLIAASYIHLRRKEYEKYTLLLPALKPRVLLSGPAGSEIYQGLSAEVLELLQDSSNDEKPWNSTKQSSSKTSVFKMGDRVRYVRPNLGIVSAISFSRGSSIMQSSMVTHGIQQ